MVISHIFLYVYQAGYPWLHDHQKNTCRMDLGGGLHVQGSIVANNFDVNIWVPGCPRVGSAKLSCSQQWLMFSAEMSQHSWFFLVRPSLTSGRTTMRDCLLHFITSKVDIEHPKWKIRNDDPLPPPNIPVIFPGNWYLEIGNRWHLHQTKTSEIWAWFPTFWYFMIFNLIFPDDFSHLVNSS